MTPGNILGTDVIWARLRKWNFRKRSTSKEVQHPVHFSRNIQAEYKHKLRTITSNRFKHIF